MQKRECSIHQRVSVAPQRQNAHTSEQREHLVPEAPQRTDILDVKYLHEENLGQRISNLDDDGEDTAEKGERVDLSAKEVDTDMAGGSFSEDVGVRGRRGRFRRCQVVESRCVDSQPSRMHTQCFGS